MNDIDAAPARWPLVAAIFRLSAAPAVQMSMALACAQRQARHGSASRGFRTQGTRPCRVIEAYQHTTLLRMSGLSIAACISHFCRSRPYFSLSALQVRARLTSRGWHTWFMSTFHIDFDDMPPRYCHLQQAFFEFDRVSSRQHSHA